VALRALLRRQHEVSADAPSQEGAQRCFERRWRRGTGAASTPCLGRMAVWIAPNRGSPRAWASAPSCGGGASSQPTLPASKAPRAALRRAGGAARAQMARLAQAERRLRSPPIRGARGRGPPRPPAAPARALSRCSTASKAPRAALRRAGGAARAQMARLAVAEWRLRSPPIAGARGRGPPSPPAAAARALSRRSQRGGRPEVL
jgi:hypothetical protein